MSTSHFVPEVWSANLLAAYEKQLVFGGPMVVNNDYEGEIAEAGDTVHITSIGSPIIADYIPNQTVIVPQNLQTGQRSLTVDQCKYWAFEVDDVDKRQQKGDFITESMTRAAYGLADVADQYVAAMHTSIPTGNNVGTVTIDHSPTDASEWNKVYDQILVPLSVRLDELDVPTEGRYCVIPPWLRGAMARDNRFVRYSESNDASVLRKGQVGEASGFQIMVSNNCAQPSTNNYVVQAGTSAAITFARQIAKTEAYRPESSFSDAMKGLSLYGAKLIRPDSIVKAIAVRQA